MSQRAALTFGAVRCFVRRDVACGAPPIIARTLRRRCIACSVAIAVTQLRASTGLYSPRQGHQQSGDEGGPTEVVGLHAAWQ